MGTRIEKAIEFFSSVPKVGNCAQCISQAFADESATLEMATCGGGNAPGGICGALHAAMSLTDDPNEKEAIHQHFIEENGSDLCKTLKNVCHTPCKKCVESAARLLDERMK